MNPTLPVLARIALSGSSSYDIGSILMALACSKVDRMSTTTRLHTSTKQRLLLVASARLSLLETYTCSRRWTEVQNQAAQLHQHGFDDSAYSALSTSALQYLTKPTCRAVKACYARKDAAWARDLSIVRQNHNGDRYRTNVVLITKSKIFASARLIFATFTKSCQFKEVWGIDYPSFQGFKNYLTCGA